MKKRSVASSARTTAAADDEAQLPIRYARAPNHSKPFYEPFLTLLRYCAVWSFVGTRVCGMRAPLSIE